MENYRRDDFWDAATWAELHQAVLDEVDRVRVARKVFYTEDLSGAPCGAPSWVSTAEVDTKAGYLRIPEDHAEPFVEISAEFQLTPAQAEAEKTLHMGRTLGRMAAKLLASAEDQIILDGGSSLRSAVLGSNTSKSRVYFDEVRSDRSPKDLLRPDPRRFWKG